MKRKNLNYDCIGKCFGILSKSTVEWGVKQRENGHLLDTLKNYLYL